MLTPNGRWTLVAAAGALVAGWVLSYPFLVGAGVALAVALALGVIAVLRRPELTARQSVQPTVVGAGEPAHSNIVVSNTGRRRTAAVVATNAVGGEDAAVAVPSLEPGGSYSAAVPLPTTRRGQFEVGPLTIERSDPLGLFRATTHRGSHAVLVVHPQVHPMSPLPTGHRRDLEGSSSEQPQEGGVSFHSLRDYVPGDDLRLIHWRSVARTGDLMVRRNIITSEPRLMILLDTWAGSYRPSITVERTSHTDDEPVNEMFEDAVRVAASLVSAGCTSHYPVLFRTTGGVRAEASANGDGRLEIMRILAGIVPSEDDPGLNGIVRFADQVEGVSLGAVTGQPPSDRTVGLSRARSRFDMVTVVQVGEFHDRPPMRIPGALVLNGADSREVAARWKARFG